MIDNYVIYRSDETVYYMDSYTIQQNIDNGYGRKVDGEYIIHCINLACISQSPPNYEQLYRFSACPTMAGFQQWCDVHQWGFARQMAAEAVTEGCITQDDYDLVDNLLPPNPT